MERHDAYRQTLEALREELADAEARVHRIRGAISSIQELLTEAPRGGVSAFGTSKLKVSGQFNGQRTLSEAAAEVLRTAERPLHVRELVRGIQTLGVGSPDPKKLRVSLVGSLDRKVRAGDTFKKVAPATYGLLKADEQAGGDSQK